MGVGGERVGLLLQTKRDIGSRELLGRMNADFIHAKGSAQVHVIDHAFRNGDSKSTLI